MYIRDPAGNLIECCWPDVETLDRSQFPELKRLEDSVPQTEEGAPRHALPRPGEDVKAAVISELGRPPELADRPEPSGEAIYEISAVSLNPLDINVGLGGTSAAIRSFRSFRAAKASAARPTARACTSSAAVSASPATGCSPSTRALRRTSASRCRTRYPTRSPPPSGIAGMAGWMPVAWRAPVKEDDRVLVLGATGTVGLVAVQAAKLLGAKHVVAAGRNPERLERAAELGADATVSLEQDDLVERLQGGGGRRRPHVRRRHALGGAGGRRARRQQHQAGASSRSASRQAPRRLSPRRRFAGRWARSTATRTSRCPGTCSASTTCGSSVMRRRATSSSTSTPIRWSGSRRPGSARPAARTAKIVVTVP